MRHTENFFVVLMGFLCRGYIACVVFGREQVPVEAGGVAAVGTGFSHTNWRRRLVIHSLPLRSW